MLKVLLTSAAAVSASLATPAIAAPILVDFTGAFSDDGAGNVTPGFTAHVNLDVANGMATSGSGTFTFHNVTRALTLITTDTPGNHNVNSQYPVGFISNGGDNVFGADQLFPLTSIGGLLFAIDAKPADGQDVLLNFYNNGGTLVSSAYGFLANDFGIPDNTTRLYTENGSLSYTAVAVSTSAVPEPATWAMMLVGFGAVGFGMRRRVRSSEVKFTNRIKRIAAGELA